MQISKDALWKGIIESLIDEFIRFFFAEYADLIDFERGFEFLDTELQKLLPENPSRRRHADKLIKVWLKDGEEVWFLHWLFTPIGNTSIILRNIEPLFWAQNWFINLTLMFCANIPQQN